MFPDLFSIGPFTLHTYGLFVAFGFFAGLAVAVKTGKSEGLGPQQVMDMGFIIIFAAITGSRLMYVLINISHYLERPADIFKVWQGGLVFSGGIICVVLAVGWYARRHGLSIWKVADLWAPAAAIGQGIGRIGCFMAGCCYGKPTGSEWGVVFTHPHCLAPANISLHPTQVYSSLSGFVIFVVLILLYSRKKFEGQVLLWFLILHSTSRLAIERFRGDGRGIIPGTEMTATQFVTTLILVASVITLLVLKSKKSRQSPTR